MSKLYEGALICLGQISSHPRLERTIPHKAFEAGFHGIPYISMKTKAILEVFPGENQAIFLENDTPDQIAETINKTLQDQDLMSKYSEGIRLRYQNELSQAKIYSHFISTLKVRKII
jgi:glycosyltransferase involved in cell wall biosynthesis